MQRSSDSKDSSATYHMGKHNNKAHNKGIHHTPSSSNVSLPFGNLPLIYSTESNDGSSNPPLIRSIDIRCCQPHWQKISNYFMSNDLDCEHEFTTALLSLSGRQHHNYFNNINTMNDNIKANTTRVNEKMLEFRDLNIKMYSNPFDTACACRFDYPSFIYT